MFDIGTSELLIIGIVVLLAVGPRDLPVFLRTVGKYVGAIKKQATEFRQHFDEALKETELDQLRKDVSGLKSDVENTVRDATRDIENDVIEAQRAIKSEAKPNGASPGSSDVAATSDADTAAPSKNLAAKDPPAKDPPAKDPMALETAEDLAAALSVSEPVQAPDGPAETASVTGTAVPGATQTSLPDTPAQVEKTNA
ncbi:MAG: Sec-independent protein translocase protein TatB [Pseudomonadota bacterium]